jgi:hypothetical protein
MTGTVNVGACIQGQSANLLASKRDAEDVVHPCAYARSNRLMARSFRLNVCVFLGNYCTLEIRLRPYCPSGGYLAYGADPSVAHHFESEFSHFEAESNP